MRAARRGQREAPRLESAINVTPLVDVVLVLLIVFMVVAPRMVAGIPLELPRTERPPGVSDDGRHLVVALAHDGGLWLDGEPADTAQFAERIREAADQDAERNVVIHGDARLSFGAVERAMLEVEAAGFRDVRLVAEPPDPTQRGG